jgi:hydroxyacylglutathione hydrolase
MNHRTLTGACGALRFQIMPFGSIRCNAVVLWHEESRDAVIVDPTDDARPVIAFSKRLGLNVHHVLLTHGHFDHAADAERACVEFSCPVSLHPDDHPIYFDIPRLALAFGQTISARTHDLDRLNDNQLLAALPDFPIVVMHVPGHSLGSVAFYLPDAHWLLAGDTLFHSGVGRTDLPGGDIHKLIESVQQRLYPLPESTQVIPGHGTITTIGHERSNNPHANATRIEPSL